MTRIDKLLVELKVRYGNSSVVTVCFMNGMHKKMTFLEALRLCVQDQSVIDATTEDETGTSLLRSIIDGNRDFSNLVGFAE